MEIGSRRLGAGCGVGTQSAIRAPFRQSIENEKEADKGHGCQAGAGQERALRTNPVPKRTGNHAGCEYRHTQSEIENAECRATQFRWSRICDQR